MSTHQLIVSVFGASDVAADDHRYGDGVECGRLLAEAGFAVATGGYAGIMEAVSEGAASAGGHVIGVTVPSAFPYRSGANSHVTEERRAAHLSERIHQLTALSDASIALPGSLGTATELMVAWNLAYVAQVARAATKPVIAVGPQWASLLEHLAIAVGADDGLVTCVGDVRSAVTAVRARLQA